MKQWSDYWDGDTNKFFVVSPKTLLSKLSKGYAPKELNEHHYASINNDHKDEKLIEPRPYQSKAINLWFENEKHGILSMATGTGKVLYLIIFS